MQSHAGMACQSVHSALQTSTIISYAPECHTRACMQGCHGVHGPKTHWKEHKVMVISVGEGADSDEDVI
jgi:hypothetical protein